MINTQTKTPTSSSSTKTWLIIISILIIITAVIGGFVYSRRHKIKPVVVEIPKKLDPGNLQTEDELREYDHQVTVILNAKGPSPQTLNIPNNTRINWQNIDSHPHTISITPGTAVPNQFYNRRILKSGDGYPFVIHNTGTFHYYYVDSPTLNGTIVVNIVR